MLHDRKESMTQLSALVALAPLVEKQKIGARFVISAPMLGLSALDFDTLAKTWIAQGGPGFVLDGIPFRKVVNGEFYIQRITVIRVA
jgi:hypothetical protein